MVKTVLLTFNDDGERDDCLRKLRAAAPYKAGRLKIDLDPPLRIDGPRRVALWVDGRKLDEGEADDMNAAFEREIVAHSASVELRADNAQRPLRQRRRTS